MILDIKDAAGNDVIDLSGNLTAHVRARSAEEVTLSIALVSGGGTQDERTLYVEGMIPAGLDQWTELTYDFRGANLNGFDSTDFRFMFTCLDRSTPNWPGNEVYLDYLSIGQAPPSADNSTFVDTSGTTSIAEAGRLNSSLSPNPLYAGQDLRVTAQTQVGAPLDFRLTSLTGKMVYHTQQTAQAQEGTYRLALPELTAGLYLLQVAHPQGIEVHKLMMK